MTIEENKNEIYGSGDGVVCYFEEKRAADDRDTKQPPESLLRRHPQPLPRMSPQQAWPEASLVEMIHCSPAL